MKGKELRDFEGKAEFRSVDNGVEILFSDEEGVRLIFTLGTEEAESFARGIRMAVRKAGPSPISAARALGQELRARREALELSAMDIAKAGGITDKSVYAVERGYVSRGAMAVEKYEEALRHYGEKRETGSE